MLAPVSESAFVQFGSSSMLNPGPFFHHILILRDYTEVTPRFDIKISLPLKPPAEFRGHTRHWSISRAGSELDQLLQEFDSFRPMFGAALSIAMKGDVGELKIFPDRQGAAFMERLREGAKIEDEIIRDPTPQTPHSAPRESASPARETPHPAPGAVPFDPLSRPSASLDR